MQTTDHQPDLSKLSTKWLKIFGVIFILGGIAALTVPVIAGIAIELLLGWVFFVGGCFQLTVAFASRQHKTFWFKFIWAIIFVLVGLWLILSPVEGIQALTFAVGMLFLVEAVMKVTFFWQWYNEFKAGWMLVSGILSFIIAMILLSGWPQQSAILLGILVGANLIGNGAVALLMSFRMMTFESTGRENNAPGSGLSPMQKPENK
ncbi:MAG: HdeD family acid-resistance protein [Burkholderiales bacterium]|nr:HdeD family acid-resistance protein [Burkholderiales bacterium]